MAKRYFHWDVVNDCVMHETDGVGATTVEYTHEPGHFGPLLSENRGGTESYHHYDALGSTTFLTDAAGNVTDTFVYDAWGNDIARTGSTPTPHKWVGRWGYQFDDPTDGYYIRVRSYQPTVARWMSVDPLFAFLHMDDYIYSINTPAVLYDPSGLAINTRTVHRCTPWYYSRIQMECECGRKFEQTFTINLAGQLGVLFNVLEEAAEASVAVQLEANVSCTLQCDEPGAGPGSRISRCKARVCYDVKQNWTYVDLTPYDMPFWWLLTGRIYQWYWEDVGYSNVTINIGEDPVSNDLSCC